MPIINPESAVSAPERTVEDIDVDAELALMGIADELDARERAASEATKQRLDDHLDAARNVTGGRGYEFGSIVDHGHATRTIGVAATRRVVGIGQRPYGMPFMATRQTFGNAYVNRNSVRY